MQGLGLCLALLGGCAHRPAIGADTTKVTPPPVEKKLDTRECEAHGGPQWHRVRSPHFIVNGPLDGAALSAEALRLETLRNFIATWFQLAPWSDPIEVWVLAGREDLEFFRAESLSGWASYSYRPWMVYERVNSRLVDGRAAKTQGHELTHLLTHRQFATLPRWVSEGLAELIEVVTLPRAGEARVWLRSKAHARHISEHGVLPVQSLWAWAEPDKHQAALYASAWAHVWALSRRYPEQWSAFMKGLAAHKPGKPLFDALFSASELAALDAKLAADIVTGNVDPQTFTFAAPQTQVTQPEPLATAEVHLFRRKVLREREEPKRHEDEAVLAAQLERTAATELALAEEGLLPWSDLLARWPADLDVQRAIGCQTDVADATTRRASLQRVLAFDPEDAEALTCLARLELRQRNRAEALALARRAVEIAPYLSKVQMTLFRTLAATDGCTESTRAVAATAVDLASEHSRRIEGLQASVEATCRSAEAVKKRGRK
ncbi:MAG: hypothetical protein Q8N26_27950 [Myxococcales bacterium]|nr:hypothetical protein [Myxococcales bacterium]